MIMATFSTDDADSGRRGFTLVELLITITILVSLAVIVIPTVRLLTRDRKVRETARVVGSVFASAREQAAVDGMAGVQIVTNPNIPEMGMTLYRMRNIPPYIGDVADARATVLGSSATLSAGNDATAAGVQENDYIEFNDSAVWYRINGPPTGPPLNRVITFDIGAADPSPPVAVALPFKIWRQPVRVESSVVTLPNRLFINLAQSGHGVSGTQFGLAATTSLQIWFNRSGTVERVYDPASGQMVIPQGSLFFLICTGDGDDVDMTNLLDAQYIVDDDNVWLVIENSTGNVSVGRIANIPPASADPVADSRTLALNRQSATP